MLRIYKDGDNFGIETDIETSEEFLQKMSGAIESIAENYKGDVAFQLSYLLPMFYEILLNLDKHENNLNISQVIKAGRIFPLDKKENNIIV